VAKRLPNLDLFRVWPSVKLSNLRVSLQSPSHLFSRESAYTDVSVPRWTKQKKGKTYYILRGRTINLYSQTVGTFKLRQNMPGPLRRPWHLIGCLWPSPCAGREHSFTNIRRTQRILSDEVHFQIRRSNINCRASPAWTVRCGCR
jgi:hypothetical protein